MPIRRRLVARAWCEVVHLVHVPYLHHHLHGLLVGPAVRGALQGGDGGHDARVIVGQRRDADHGGEGRGVEAVLRGQHEVGVEGVGVFFGWLFAFEHVQEVGCMAQVAIGGHRLLAVTDAAVGGHDGGHPGAEDYRLLYNGVVGGVVHVGVEQRHGGDHGAEDVYRLAGFGQAAQHLHCLGGQLAVSSHSALKLAEFRFSGQFAVQQQIKDLFIRGVCSQVLYHVAPVAEASLCALDIADHRIADNYAFQPFRACSTGHILSFPFCIESLAGNFALPARSVVTCSMYTYPIIA